MSSQQVVDFVQSRIGTKSLTEIGAEICDQCCAPDTSGDGTGCEKFCYNIICFYRCDNMTIIIVDLDPKSRELLPLTSDELEPEPPVDPIV